MTDQEIYDALAPFVNHSIRVICKGNGVIIGDLAGVYRSRVLLGELGMTSGYVQLCNCVLIRGNLLHPFRHGEADVMFHNIRSATSYPRGRIL